VAINTMQMESVTGAMTFLIASATAALAVLRISAPAWSISRLRAAWSTYRGMGGRTLSMEAVDVVAIAASMGC